MCKTKSKTKKVFGIIGMVVGGIALVLLLSFAVMWLWNALMPQIFGLGTITYWQGVGLALLGRLLLGGFGGGSGGDSDKKHKHPVRSEFKKEFKKEFAKEFKKHMTDECGDDLAEAWMDDAYEDWWKSEGRDSFKAFAKNKDDDEK